MKSLITALNDFAVMFSSNVYPKTVHQGAALMREAADIIEKLFIEIDQLKKERDTIAAELGAVPLRLCSDKSARKECGDECSKCDKLVFSWIVPGEEYGRKENKNDN